MMALYPEDFSAGQTFVSGSAEPEAVTRFATVFDAAVTMKLLVTAG